MHKPEFYERQRMRASTYNIPRFLYSFDETIDGSLVLRAACSAPSPRSPNRRAAG
jgi:hypothetical protein